MPPFQQLNSGESVFLDANTLVYHFEPHPLHGQNCSQLLTRIDQQDLRGYTSTHILSEMTHRLMMVEAATLPGWTASKVKLRLRQNPAALSNLKQFRTAIESVLQSRIVVLSIASSLIANAAVYLKTTAKQHFRSVRRPSRPDYSCLLAAMAQHALWRLSPFAPRKYVLSRSERRQSDAAA